MIKLPNIPNVLGQIVGRVLHGPVDFAKGVRKGFTKNTDEQIEDVSKQSPKVDPESTTI